MDNLENTAVVGGATTAQEPAATSGEIANNGVATEPVAQQPTETQGDESVGEGRYVLKADPNTGRKSLVYEEPGTQVQDSTDQTTDHVENITSGAENNGDGLVQQQNNTVAGVVQQSYNDVTVEPPKYNLQEFSIALASNNVDERRVPPEFQEKYVEHTINKAQKEYDAYITQQAQQREALERQLNAQPTKEESEKFFNDLNAEAERRAYESLGLTKEEYEDKELEDETLAERMRVAKEWERSKLINEVQAKAKEQADARAQQQSIMKEINEFVVQQRSAEPHFNEIDIQLRTLYKTLPYEKAKPVAEALQSLVEKKLTLQQVAVLKDYYETARKMFYAKQNGLQINKAQTIQQQRPQPPVVENPGNGAEAPATGMYSVNDLRNAKNLRERRNILTELLNASRKH